MLPNRSGNFAPELTGGGVGVLWEEADGVRVGQVGGVDAGVGADETVMGLGDQDAALCAQHLFALFEDQLDQGWVLVEPLGESMCFLAAKAAQKV